MTTTHETTSITTGSGCPECESGWIWWDDDDMGWLRRPCPHCNPPKEN